MAGRRSGLAADDLSPLSRVADRIAGKESDVCVVGAGPAGLACAIAAAQRGLTVCVVDGMRPPVDKACGEGLMPETVAALAELGVRLDVASGGAHLSGIRFLDTSTGAVAEAEFASGGGRGIKRMVLHRMLLDRAAELGVMFEWQTVVQGVDEGVVWTNLGRLRAKFIVGADGQSSQVREWAGLGRATVRAKRLGLRQHFAVTPWTESVEVHWSDHGQAYVTPVASDEVCVAFVAQGKFCSVAAAMEHFPQLRERLGAAAATDTPRGAVTFSRRVRRVTRGRVALVGDASGSVDAVTGEGLSLCFRQALALGGAMAVGDLGQYERAHARMMRLPQMMARMLLLMDRRPRLRGLAIRTFEAHPHLFTALLATHTGDAGVRVLGRGGLLQMGLALGLVWSRRWGRTLRTA